MEKKDVFFVIRATISEVVAAVAVVTGALCGDAVLVMCGLIYLKL